MQRRNLDFQIPLTREQWQQLGDSANLRPDYGVLRWDPTEFDVIRVAMQQDEHPAGFAQAVPQQDAVTGDDREVARFVYNDGRPFAELQPPPNLTRPAVSPDEERALDQQLERWVREKWHGLLRDSGIDFDRGALPLDEPNSPR
jgi:hypothetical protein